MVVFGLGVWQSGFRKMIFQGGFMNTAEMLREERLKRGLAPYVKPPIKAHQKRKQITGELLALVWGVVFRNKTRFCTLCGNEIAYSGQAPNVWGKIAQCEDCHSKHVISGNTKYCMHCLKPFSKDDYLASGGQAKGWGARRTCNSCESDTFAMSASVHKMVDGLVGILIGDEKKKVKLVSKEPTPKQIKFLERRKLWVPPTKRQCHLLIQFIIEGNDTLGQNESSWKRAGIAKAYQKEWDGKRVSHRYGAARSGTVRRLLAVSRAEIEFWRDSHQSRRKLHPFKALVEWDSGQVSVTGISSIQLEVEKS